MTYNMHYPNFNEKGVPIESYMKDMPQFVEDYNFLKENKIPDSRLSILSDLELITEKEAEKYIVAQDTLELALTAKATPSKFEPDEDVTIAKSGAFGFCGGVGAILAFIPLGIYIGGIFPICS